MESAISGLIGALVGGILLLLGQGIQHRRETKTRRGGRLSEFRLQALSDLVNQTVELHNQLQTYWLDAWVNGDPSKEYRASVKEAVVGDLSIWAARLRAKAMLADPSGTLLDPLRDLAMKASELFNAMTTPEVQLAWDNYRDENHSFMLRLSREPARILGEPVSRNVFAAPG